MKRSTFQVIGLCLGIALVAPLTCYGPSYLLSMHTPWCPLSHKLSDTAACVLLDRDGEWILIQHADLDTEEAYFELLTPAGSRRFEIPAFLTVLAPTGYVGRLIPGEEAAFLIDGRRHQGVPIP